MDKIKDSLKQLDEQQLELEAERFRREIFNLRLSKATSAVNDTSQMSKLRRNLARTLTYLGQKRRQRVDQGASQ